MPTDLPPDMSSLKAHVEPLKIMGAIFVVCSLGGLASLLRSDKPITVRLVMSALLNSGLIGLVIALVWWNSYKDTNLYFLTGVSLLAGMGGATAIDFLYQFAAKRFMGKTGIKIVIQQDDDKEVKP